jgi:hypothetical protein
MHHSSVDADSGMIIDFDALHTREGLDAAFATLRIAPSVDRRLAFAQLARSLLRSIGAIRHLSMVCVVHF